MDRKDAAYWPQSRNIKKYPIWLWNIIAYDSFIQLPSAFYRTFLKKHTTCSRAFVRCSIKFFNPTIKWIAFRNVDRVISLFKNITHRFRSFKILVEGKHWKFVWSNISAVACSRRFHSFLLWAQHNAHPSKPFPSASAQSPLPSIYLTYTIRQSGSLNPPPLISDNAITEKRTSLQYWWVLTQTASLWYFY